MTNWSNALWALPTVEGSVMMLAFSALLLFPKLALGLSGFETGVVVMPLIKSEHDLSREEQKKIHSTFVTEGGMEPNIQQHLDERIANGKKLLSGAALIMSVMLIGSSIVTTMLIPAEEFYEGGEANGRALSYLAHTHLGDIFGTVYDISTILILWFAGASAMAGLLNIVPRYLPRFGMAPDWARATRPLVIIFTAIAFLVTVLFHADVDSQGGAYATGVLMLMTSAAVAVTISAWKKKEKKWIAFLFITIGFLLYDRR